MDVILNRGFALILIFKLRASRRAADRVSEEILPGIVKKKLGPQFRENVDFPLCNQDAHYARFSKAQAHLSCLDFGVFDCLG